MLIILMNTLFMRKLICLKFVISRIIALGNLLKRKPHIHIVIPKVNLITEKFLNPVGDVTKGHTIEQLDAIQEFINNKYNLDSPKDYPRKDADYGKIISRVKGIFTRASL